MESGTPTLGDRRRRETVWVDHLRGEALRHLRLEPRIAKRLQRRVGVHVDETGAEHQASSVDHLRHIVGGESTLNSRDTIAGDANVGVKLWSVSLCRCTDDCQPIASGAADYHLT